MSEYRFNDPAINTLQVISETSLSGLVALAVTT